MSDGKVQILDGAVLTTPDGGVATADECCCLCPCPGEQPDADVLTSGVCAIPANQAFCDACTGAATWSAFGMHETYCEWTWTLPAEGEVWQTLELVWYVDHMELTLRAFGGAVYRNLDMGDDLECVAGVWTGTVICAAVPGTQCPPMQATVTFG